MCQEVFEIVQKMDLTQAEAKLALYCAPVITGIKVSNLLHLSTDEENAIRTILKKTGMIYYRLLRKDGKTFFLIFRKTPLTAYLENPDVQRILKANGYTDLSLGGILRTFQYRFEACRNQGEDFPHEMGLLLGYPAEDVEGFMQHKGRNYLYSGYWKVYRNVEEKQRLFKAYETAKECLIQLLAEGYDMYAIVRNYQICNMKIRF